MPSRRIYTLAGFILVLIGVLFVIAQILSPDHLHNRWRSLGLGELNPSINFVTFAVILAGAITVIVTAVRSMKDFD